MSNLWNALANAVHLIVIPASRRAVDFTGTAIDVLDHEGVGAFTLNCSDPILGTNPTLSVHLEHSDDNITFADVTGGAFTQVGATGGLQTKNLNVSNLKRYVRAIAVLGGTGTPTYDYAMEFAGFKKSS